jgi:V8-like Glu-specific endopeptidase
MIVARRDPEPEALVGVREAFAIPGQQSVTNTRELPWQMVFAIEVGNIERGTGWAFGRSMVVTARHVIDEAAGNVIRVYPARDGGRAAPPLIADTFLLGSSGDYGAIFFSGTPIGQFGTFGLNPAAAVQGERVVLAGFDPEDGATTLWTGSEIAQDEGVTFSYDIITVPGQSGAPVWLAGNEGELVGLHVSRRSGRRHAQRITTAISHELSEWRIADERGEFRRTARVAVNLASGRAEREPGIASDPARLVAPGERSGLSAALSMGSAHRSTRLALSPPLVPSALPLPPLGGSESAVRASGPAIVKRAGALRLDVDDHEPAGPRYAADTVIVKLREQPGAERLLAFGHTAFAAPAGSSLDDLRRNGYVAKVAPVFGNAFAAARHLSIAGAAVTAAVTPPRAADLVSVTCAPTVDVADLAAFVDAQADVEYAFVPAVKYPCARQKAQPTAKVRRPRATKAQQPNDPLRSRQWSYSAIHLDTARARPGFSDAAGITVAVLDSGIDVHHPDLAGMIASYQNFLAAEDDRDYQGHGTHVAGIISAVINNAVGISGICAARIMVLKALPRRGGRWDAAAYYRALAQPMGSNARVLNLSLGGALDRAEQDIVADLIEGGVTVVAAMGNDFERANPLRFPAAYEGVIAVGASDQVDRRAAFSCTGPHIALVAPGVDILSTVPTTPSELSATTLYDSWPGTSMATPHVAAAIALLLAREPELTPAQVRQRVIAAADRVRWQSAVPDPEYGAGRLNIAALLQ